MANENPSCSSTQMSSNSVKTQKDQPPKKKRSYLSLKRKQQLEAAQKQNQKNHDRLMCKFFVRNGIPCEAAQDPLFVKLFYSQDNSCIPPTAQTIDSNIRELATEMKNGKIAVDKRTFWQPVAVTIDTVENDHDFFLAFSLHYFVTGSPRKNVVHLCKMNTMSTDLDSIMAVVKQSVNSQHKDRIQIQNLVTANPKVSNHFLNSQFVNRNYVCYFTCISNFAEEIILIPKFQEALEILRNFYMDIREDSDYILLIKKFFTDLRNVPEIPQTYYSKWSETLKFLELAMSNQDLLMECAYASSMREFDINGEIYDIVSQFETLLTYLQKSVMKLSNSDSYVSEVLPEIIEIKKLIILTFPEGVVKDTIITELKTHLDSLTRRFKNECYEIATFLDPRFAYDTKLYSSAAWDTISSYVRTSIMKNTTVGEKMSFLDKKMSLDLEMLHYQSIVTQNRPNQDPLIWLKRHSGQFSLLFKAALLFIAPPPCAIDGQQYFGPRGKYVINSHKMTFEQFNNSLTIASSMEVFRGRGFIENNKNSSESSPEIEPKTNDIEEEESEDTVKQEPMDFADLSNYLMLEPEREQKMIEVKVEIEELKPEIELVHIERKPEDVINAKSEQRIVARSENVIETTSNRRIFVKMPLQQTAMERVLGRKIATSSRSSTSTSSNATGEPQKQDGC